MRRTATTGFACCGIARLPPIAGGCRGEGKALDSSGARACGNARLPANGRRFSGVTLAMGALRCA